MSKEIFLALDLLKKERGIPVDFMLQKIEKSILTACKSNYGNEDIVVNIEPENDGFDVFLRKVVKDRVEHSGSEISLKDAIKIDEDAEIGKKVLVKLDTKEFGRIAAQTARNIIRQGIRDSEHDQISKEFKSLQKEIVSAVIEKVDYSTGAVTLRIGKAETTLVSQGQVGTENLKEGEHIKVYIVDVKETERGPKIIISRTHPDFVGKLFKNEVPEISDGILEVKSIAREPGVRTKIAVFSNNPDVEPIGACIGPGGLRINAVMEELGGEKIDVVEFFDDPVKFITAAISPAKVLDVIIDSSEEKKCKIVVPNSQLSLAIGSKGQNVRLAAKLTHFKIDIVSQDKNDSDF
ncbi:MAG: transcription termination factor NusA [Oscillospiraceae bacterium]|jgi:N utilization substance protein A|nr:transcription termination factor NusA [Oscillospiraceae bacterium]